MKGLFCLMLYTHRKRNKKSTIRFNDFCCKFILLIFSWNFISKINTEYSKMYMIRYSFKLKDLKLYHEINLISILYTHINNVNYINQCSQPLSVPIICRHFYLIIASVSFSKVIVSYIFILYIEMLQFLSMYCNFLPKQYREKR